MTTARILKADQRSRDVHRVRLADLSEPRNSRPTSSEFTPLALPNVRRTRVESLTDERVESALTALQSAVSQLQAQRDDWLERSHREAVEVGVAIAERLLRRTLEVQPDAILNLIRTALEWAPETNTLRLRLHSADAETIAANAHAITANRTLEIVADDSLARGDSVLETPQGQTDARLSVVLQRIADELLAE
jgi:flagellar assembly protein FliH